MNGLCPMSRAVGIAPTVALVLNYISQQHARSQSP